MMVYFNGQYIEKSEVVISPEDSGFLFADGVYEVIRAYEGSLFKCNEHLARLDYGLKELRIQGCDAPGLEPVANRLLKENSLEGGDATVYIQVTRGAAPRTHRFPPSNIAPTVYVEAKPFSSPLQAQEEGAPAILVPDQRWARCDLKAIALLPNILANQLAFERGALEAIFSRAGVLQEGSHSSILFVKDDLLIFPPLTNYVLPSVTRSVVLSLAAHESIEAAIQPCVEAELWKFQEILMVGTTVEIVQITFIIDNKVESGHLDLITNKLQGA